MWCLVASRGIQKRRFGLSPVFRSCVSKRFNSSPPEDRAAEQLLSEMKHTLSTNVKKHEFERRLLKMDLWVILPDGKIREYIPYLGNDQNKYFTAFTTKERIAFPEREWGDKILDLSKFKPCEEEISFEFGTSRVDEMLKYLTNQNLGLHLNPNSSDHPVIRWSPNEVGLLNNVANPRVVKQKSDIVIGPPAADIRCKELEEFVVDYARKNPHIEKAKLAISCMPESAYHEKGKEPVNNELIWDYVAIFSVNPEILATKKNEIKKDFVQSIPQSIYGKFPEKAQGYNITVEVNSVSEAEISGILLYDKIN